MSKFEFWFRLPEDFPSLQDSLSKDFNNMVMKNSKAKDVLTL